MYMQKLIVLGGAGAAVAIGVVTLWQNRAPVERSAAPVRVEAPAAAPVAASAVVSRRAAAPPAVAEATAAVAVGVEHLADEIDDGDNHGHADHEQGDIVPFEEPAPSRDAFGADPDSETAALAEARATLEALLTDPDPAVKKQASELLEIIASP
jgi:hypothetical protein